MTEKLEQMEVDPRSDGANVNVVAPDDTNGVQGGNTELSVQSAAARDQEPESSPTSQGTVTGKREECNSNDTYKSIDQSMMIELNPQSSGRTTRDGCVGTSDQEKVMPCEDRKRIPQSPLGDENLSKKIKESSPSRDYDIPAALSSNSQPTSDEINASYENMEPAIAEIIRDKLEDIVDIVPLKPLSLRDLAELENSLQIGDKYDYSPDDGWKKDWSGNLQLFEKDIVVNRGYVTSQPNIKPIKIPFYEWVAKSSAENNCLRGLELLFSFVYHMKGTPQQAQRILAYAVGKPANSLEHRLEFIIDAIRRITYDPVVLQQDGWITKRAESPEGSMGGSSLIGRRIIWQKYEAVIIAFTLDETWGSLWKAIWVEDLETFDLEADEVQDALAKWEKRQARVNKKKTTSTTVVAGGTRNAATTRFIVDGIEHGIILALPPKVSRGVMWPARVMHVAETNGSYSGNRRNATKFQIKVVFLAPFWNSNTSSSSREDARDPYSLGPMFEWETIEVSENTLKKYPFDRLSIEDLMLGFKFLGLPKAVLSRYLDSHRLALALKTYARKYIPTNYLPGDDDAFASASLTESHVLSVLTPMFPQEVLDLPFDFILRNLPRPSEHASAFFDNDETTSETVVDIKSIIDSMSPPLCYGRKQLEQGTDIALSPENNKRKMMMLSPSPNFTPMSNRCESENAEKDDVMWSVNNFASELLVELFETSQAAGNLHISYLAQLLSNLILHLRGLLHEFKDFDVKKQRKELKRILCHCLVVKGCGEDFVATSTLPSGYSVATVAVEWRKACERVYKRAVSKLHIDGGGNGYTSVVTDSRCNGHITADGAFERPVRLPAAIKGAKLAGAGTDSKVLLINTVEDIYLEVAEDNVIPRAHQRSYIKRLKSKITSISSEDTGVPLTDDSEGEGGDDTKGSRGSYTAAVVGIAAAIKAVDMVVGGQCVNIFCAVRPPGHHAGRELRPMKAVSNGFCIFNAAACAAIYATTPQSLGGLGLRRVCVIDFDVHHGNGTQDILCNTHDPRFLYISMHAGGAHINGFDEEDSDGESFRLKPGSKTTEGIFPGRCGDSSPHDGVLNIPLGKKVTPTDLGTALVSKVLPKVENFSPDLIILSAGFDAHKNDPLGMGGLSAEDFGHLTEVACQLAYKTCSGRIISVLEGGYGVPCCRPRNDLFLPEGETEKLLDLGEDLPDSMGDPVPGLLRQRLEKCHAEGFVECVKEHVKSFVKFNKRT